MQLRLDQYMSVNDIFLCYNVNDFSVFSPFVHILFSLKIGVITSVHACNNCVTYRIS